MGATEEMGGPPQRTEAPPPAADLPQTGKPSGGADQPAIPNADPPGMAANGGGEASTAGQPGAEPEESVPDAEHEAGLPPPSAHGAQPAGRADAAPLATPAHHADASAPGEAPPRGHLKPARSPKPGKPHRTRPSARPTGKRRPAGTTATNTLSMPSWSPA